MTQLITTLKDYSDWTLSVWYSPKYAPNKTDTTNISVMALGLAGEVSEVIAECLNINVCESDTQHELGDVIYYWTRICNTFDIDLVDLYDRSAKLAARNPKKELPMLLLQLSKNSGLAADVIKKYIRDEKLNKPLLENKLCNIMSNLLNILTYYDYHLFDIINMNVDKIEARKKDKEKQNQ